MSTYDLTTFFLISFLLVTIKIILNKEKLTHGVKVRTLKVRSKIGTKIRILQHLKYIFMAFLCICNLKRFYQFLLKTHKYEKQMRLQKELWPNQGRFSQNFVCFLSMRDNSAEKLIFLVFVHRCIGVKVSRFVLKDNL